MLVACTMAARAHRIQAILDNCPHGVTLKPTGVWGAIRTRTQVQSIARANDPVYEFGFRVMGRRTAARAHLDLTFTAGSGHLCSLPALGLLLGRRQQRWIGT
jgi:hypothetical protein